MGLGDGDGVQETRETAALPNVPTHQEGSCQNPTDLQHAVHISA